jgi:hypothetical protein
MERSYTVTGQWPFPTEMVTYDQAWAATREDQILIERMSGEVSDEELGVRTKVSINLVMNSGASTRSRPNGHWLPNAARWDSFGWTVSGVPEIDDMRYCVEQDRKNDELRKSALSKLTDEERRVLGLK